MSVRGDTDCMRLFVGDCDGGRVTFRLEEVTVSASVRFVASK